MSVCRQGQGESALFSDEESDGGGESSHGEEDEEDESEGDGGETADEHDDDEEDEFSFAPDDQLERRQSSAAGLMNAAASAGGQERANLAPQHMQWALRPRTKAGGRSSSAAAAAAAAAAASGGGGFIYIDPTSLRRTSGGAAAAAAVAAATAGGLAGAADHQVTMYTTASALARSYGVVIRQVADLLTMLQDYASAAPCLPRLLSIGMDEFYSLLSLVEEQLRPNWTWLMTVMDSTEAQLRFGSALSNSSDPSHPSHPLYASSRGRGSGGGGSGGGGGGGIERSSASSSSRSGGLGGDTSAGRRDFLQYALSLMRAHHSEHLDSLPVIDVSAMRHIAYAFDALIYYMRAGDMSEESGAPSAKDGAAAGYLDPASLAYDENDNDDDLQDELPVMATVRGELVFKIPFMANCHNQQ